MYVDDLDVRSHSFGALIFFVLLLFFIPFVQKAFQLRRSFVMHALLIWYSHLFCISCCDSFCFFFLSTIDTTLSPVLWMAFFYYYWPKKNREKKPLLKQWYVILAFDINISKFKLKVIGGYFSHNVKKRSNLSQNLLNEPRFRNNLTITKSAYCSFHITLCSPWSVVRIFIRFSLLPASSISGKLNRNIPKIPEARAPLSILIKENIFTSNHMFNNRTDEY